MSSRTRLGLQCRLKNSRAESFNSFCGLLRSNSMTVSVTLRQSQHAFRNDVSLNLAGACFDRIAPRSQVAVLPHAAIEITELAIRSKDLLCGLLGSLVPLAPVEFLD